jgi:hypothetical protein
MESRGTAVGVDEAKALGGVEAVAAAQELKECEAWAVRLAVLKNAKSPLGKDVAGLLAGIARDRSIGPPWSSKRAASAARRRRGFGTWGELESQWRS